VSRALLFIVLSLLFADASGLAALVSPEQCTVLEESLPDGKCPPLCVRCACSAQPVVPDIAPLVVGDFVRSDLAVYVSHVSTASPPDILHVPK
jgi:hypothetical protein